MSIVTGINRLRAFVIGAAVLSLILSLAPVASAAPALDHVESSEAAVVDAVAMIRDYFAAINQRDYPRAYYYWHKGSDGLPSTGQTFEQFKQGFAETERVAVEIGSPGPLEQTPDYTHITIPVTITATTSDGRTQRFSGTYTLRYSAQPREANHHWRIYRADIAEVPPEPTPVTPTPAPAPVTPTPPSADPTPAPVALPATGGSPPPVDGGSGWPLGLLAALAVAGAAVVRFAIRRGHNP